MADEKKLPGWPSKALVKKVKSCLWHYLRSRPQVNDPLWRTTWEWACEIKNRNMLFVFGKQSRRERWPAPNEIASTFLYLAMAEMQTSIRLPMNAKDTMPESVKKILNLAAKLQAIRANRQPLLHCLMFLACVGIGRVAEPMEIVLHRWPQSRQPEKKLLTITKHLQSLVRSGYCMNVGTGMYCITKSGLKAYHCSVDELNDDRVLFKPGQKPVLKLVKG